MVTPPGFQAARQIIVTLRGGEVSVPQDIRDGAHVLRPVNRDRGCGTVAKAVWVDRRAECGPGAGSDLMGDGGGSHGGAVGGDPQGGGGGAPTTVATSDQHRTIHEDIVFQVGDELRWESHLQSALRLGVREDEPPEIVILEQMLATSTAAQRF